MRGLWLVFALMVSLQVGWGVACVVVFVLHGWRPFLVVSACFIAFWFVAELVTGVVLYTYARFVPEQRDQSADQAAAADK